MRKFVSICVIALLSMQFMVAQTTITGKVTAKKDGKAIAGAVITAKGDATVTTTSGADGNYSIVVPKGVKVIDCTYEGMNKNTKGLAEKTTINFEMTVKGEDEGEVNENEKGVKDEKKAKKEKKEKAKKEKAEKEKAEKEKAEKEKEG
jgi:hypothetical protein